MNYANIKYFDIADGEGVRTSLFVSGCRRGCKNCFNSVAWDFAAGELIAREAGAIVCDFTGGHNYMSTGNIVAGNPRVVKAMLANMRDELSDALKR